MPQYIKLKFNLIDKDVLFSYNITPGNIYVCRYNGNYEYYYDANYTSRIKSRKFKYEPDCYSLEDLKALPGLTSTLIYITADGGFFIYDSIAKTWSPAIYMHDISTILGTYDTLNPATAYNYDENGIKINYAFKTIASAVYLNDGKTVESALKNITRMGMSTNFVTCEEDGQTEFVIPYPDPFTKENYLLNGNGFLVFIGSTLIDSHRYLISEDHSKLKLTDSTLVKKDRTLEFIFIYNTTVAESTDDVSVAVNGNMIIDKSIPTQKLELTTTSYTVNEPNTIATAASVYKAVQYLLEKINAIDITKVIFAMTTGVGNAFHINVAGYTLLDGANINLKLNAPLLDNATLTVNGGEAIPIYKDYNNPIKQYDVHGDTICLYYNAEETRFYITSGITRSLNHSVYRYVAEEDGIAYIDLYKIDPDTGKTVCIFDFNPFMDNLTLYQDGIYLIDGVNYSFNIQTGRISFLNYTLDLGTEIVFETQYISQLRMID